MNSPIPLTDRFNQPGPDELPDYEAQEERDEIAADMKEDEE